MRVGIVGSGNIVVTCLNAISQIAEITCEAIVVRESSRAKGEALAKEFGMNKIYTDYQAFSTILRLISSISVFLIICIMNML